jgi:hypothetical protein
MSDEKLPPVIGICGGIGCGKDTVTTYLALDLGYDRVSIAEPMKEIVRDVYDLDHRQCFGTQSEKAVGLEHVRDVFGGPRTPRYLMEAIGMAFRECDPNTWVKFAERKIKHILAQGGRVAISDARFLNEFEMIRDCGGVIWRVDKVGGRQENRDHPSDQEWRRLPVDAILVARAGDLNSLREQAVQIARAGGRTRSEEF